MIHLRTSSQLIGGLSFTLMASLMMSGCGAKGGNPIAQIVTNIAVKTSVQNSEDWVQATATLNTGGFQVAGISFPLSDFKSPAQYGQITLTPISCTKNCNGYSADLTIQLNISQISREPSGSPLLPNGTPLPVGGLQNATTIAIPIANTGAQLYFAFAKGVALLGTAIPFSVLDPAGHYLPGVDVFQPFTAGPIQVTAGIFAGAAPKTTGIGLFMDISGVLNTNTVTPTVVRNFAANLESQVPSKITLSPVHPSQSKENRLFRKIYGLSQQGLKLEMKNE